MPSFTPSVLPLATAFALSLATPAAAAAEPPIDPLRALQQLGQALSDTGYRLATAGAALCEPLPLPGFQVQDLSQYPRAEQTRARETFGFGAEPLVFAVPAGSPAAEAGLRADDAILAIDGVALPPSEARPNSFTRVAQVLDLLEKAASDGTLTLSVRRGDRLLDISFAPARGCASRFELRIARSVDAEADGQYVVINSGVFELADEPEQLAAVVAHELAHNILRHKQRLDKSGRGVAAVRATEEEADRLSVYLLDGAGYSIAGATRFLSKLARRDLFELFGSMTHLSERDRILIMEDEARRIAKMKAAGDEPRPQFMMVPTP